jgi:ABC-type antimicrobial peptide transport system, ATPase component
MEFLKIEKGEVTAIIGFSCSSQSILFHIIDGVDVHTSGKVYLEEQNL